MKLLNKTTATHTTAWVATRVARAEAWSRSLVPASVDRHTVTCPACGAHVPVADARRPVDLLSDVATVVAAIRPTNQVLVVARIAAALVLVVLRVRGSIAS